MGHVIECSMLAKTSPPSFNNVMEHHVYFWLTEEKQNPEDRAAFEAGLKDLFKIEEVASGVWAITAKTEVRPVTVNSWHYALSLKFVSQVEHDAYQVHPEHDVFVEKFKSYWSQVQVMDLEESQ